MGAWTFFRVPYVGHACHEFSVPDMIIYRYQVYNVYINMYYTYTYLEETLLHLVTESTSDKDVERDVRPDAELDLWGCDSFRHSAVDVHIVRFGGPLMHFW